VYLDTYWIPANAVDDDGNGLGVQIMYDGPDYPLELEFKAPSVVDVLVTVGQAESTPLMDVDNAAYGYTELVPVKIWSVDKTGVTAVKAIWQAEAEVRRILETYPTGSQRGLERTRSATLVLGSTTLYGAEYTVNYRRDTT